MEESPPTLPPRYKAAQVNRSLIHPTLSQPTDESARRASGLAPIHSLHHCFVVAADTQLGMTAANVQWEIEVDYSRRAVAAINALQPRPLFCCVCGDLVDMTASLYHDTPKAVTEVPTAQASSESPETSQTSPVISNDPETSPTSPEPSNAKETDTPKWSMEECHDVQEQQYTDFQSIWSDLHPDICLVCVCGNHDVGNRPTAATIQRFTQRFGDDHLAFWANGTYNIVVNTALFSDPTDAPDLYDQQLAWLRHRLEYATLHQARHIFVYGHHPWFLYQETEQATDLTGASPLPYHRSVPDSYFVIPPRYRQVALDLFRQHGVSAAFAGHFHQNVVTKASFGMEMIVTGSLSMVLDSTGNDTREPKTQGFRIVQVEHDGSEREKSTFHHRFVALPE